jgi:hemerythrin
MEWSDGLSVGFKDIDEQHKRWIDIYNTAHDKMMAGSSGDLKSLGISALEEMITYSESHFAYEERLMEKIGYPGLDLHRVIHQNFSRKLQQTVQKMREGEFVLNSEIIKMIERWLIDHILNEDMKIKPIAATS